jgi:hypothetical protein
MPSASMASTWLEHLLDLRPAFDLEQDVAAGRTKGSV